MILVKDFSESSIYCSDQTAVFSFLVGKRSQCKLFVLQKAFADSLHWSEGWVLQSVCSALDVGSE